MSLYDPQREASRQNAPEGVARYDRREPAQQAAESQAAIRASDDAAVDAYLRHHCGVEPPEGLRAPTDQPSNEDEQFDAYMRTHFPRTPE